MNQEALRIVVMGNLADNYPELIPAVKARAEELKEEFKQRMAMWETEDQKAVELTAYSLFVVDLPEIIEEVSK